MNIDKKQYKKYADAHAPKSPLLKDCVRAFLVGGGICVLAEALTSLYLTCFDLSKETASTLTSITLIFIAVTLTALGIFDKIAKHAGAGTLVPITGFSNAMTSPALDTKSEGYIMGVGAKMFTVAGPVLLYAMLSGAVCGSLYYLYLLIF